MVNFPNDFNDYSHNWRAGGASRTCCGRFWGLFLLVMKSPILVVLLIVNLLTCPLRCLACESQSASSVESACATCACCSECDPVTVPDAPVPHDDNCGCTSCICEGAVVVNPVELPELGPTLHWLLPLCLDGLYPSIGSEFLERHAFRHSGLIFSGRDARISHQSWQI